MYNTYICNKYEMLFLTFRQNCITKTLPRFFNAKGHYYTLSSFKCTIEYAVYLKMCWSKLIHGMGIEARGNTYEKFKNCCGSK